MKLSYRLALKLIVLDDSFMIKNDCNDATLRWSMHNTTYSQFSLIDSVILIKENSSITSDSSSRWDKEL